MSVLLAELAPFLAQAREALVAYAAVFARIGAAVFFLPILGERVVPARVRLACALSLTVLTAPLVRPALPSDPGPAFLLSETAIGLAFGFSVRAFTLALQIAGTAIAQSISLAQFLGAPSAEPVPALGHLLLVTALALLGASGFPLVAVESSTASYDLVPPGGPHGAAGLADWTIASVAGAFALAMRLAAPFVALGLVYTMTLGFLSRAMPQLMVALVGAPAIALAGIALAALVGPGLMAVWLQAVAEHVR